MCNVRPCDPLFVNKYVGMCGIKRCFYLLLIYVKIKLLNIGSSVLPISSCLRSNEHQVFYFIYLFITFFNIKLKILFYYSIN